MTWQRFDRSQLPAAPWKNGGGITHEIVCHPPGSDLESFDWRISIAQISGDGAFSRYPGVDRVITLLHGQGVHLSSADGSIEHSLDRALLPYSFAGEAAVWGRLLGGECWDLNVMSRRKRCRAHVRTLRQALDLDATACGLLLAVGGNWRGRCSRGLALLLSAGQGVWWSDCDTGWNLIAEDDLAALLVVEIETVTP